MPNKTGKGGRGSRKRKLAAARMQERETVGWMKIDRLVDWERLRSKGPQEQFELVRKIAYDFYRLGFNRGYPDGYEDGELDLTGQGIL